MKEQGGGMETYLTIEEVAAYLKLANQTIRKYVLNKTIPYRKVQKSVRFRLSEIERWIDEGGGNRPDYPADGREGDLFAGLEEGESCCPPAAGGETGQAGEAERGTGADGQAGGAAADGSGEARA
ncbi:MAG: helix-turn-helix domain-containing protein [Treponema sp.]|jgi:excisionase family DNA binding protein|nr:helix-turn-helix domain-containing protein [Treponema sp.]